MHLASIVSVGTKWCLKHTVFGLLLTISFIMSVYAETLDVSDDVTLYCKYVTEKNQAKRRLLFSPDVIVQVQNTSNSYPFQNNFISGLSKNLSDLSKAKQVNQLIKDECQYYKMSQRATLQIQFAIPKVQTDALNFKLQQIKIAKNKLNNILGIIHKKIENQNDTLNSYYQVETALQKLEMADRNIRGDLAIQQLPKIEPLNLNKLMHDLGIAQKNRQATRNKLEKQNNWSLQLQAGAQQSLFYNQNQSVQPYLALFMRYNLGSVFANHKLDQSLTSYMNWKDRQINGMQNQLLVLIRSIAALRASELQRLHYLKQIYKKNDGLTKKMTGIASTKADHFGQKIEVDQIMMAIEIKYVQYIIDLLKKIDGTELT
jgi:hypothetical protein